MQIWIPHSAHAATACPLQTEHLAIYFIPDFLPQKDTGRASSSFRKVVGAANRNSWRKSNDCAPVNKCAPYIGSLTSPSNFWIPLDANERLKDPASAEGTQADIVFEFPSESQITRAAVPFFPSTME